VCVGDDDDDDDDDDDNDDNDDDDDHVALDLAGISHEHNTHVLGCSSQ
jgi:hypothetical protein